MLARNYFAPLRLLTGAVTLSVCLGGCGFVPHPLTDDQRTTEAHEDLAYVYAAQEPLTHALTLQEAFARAMTYNLDERVKLMERQVAERDFEISKFDMLPKVIATAGASTRDNELGSSSISVVTRTQTLEPSTSTDRDLKFADLTTSWNILDFWVSYFNSKQQADRVLVAEEQRRRVLQGLFQDVRRAFWRAASAQRLTNDVRVAIHDAENSLEASRKGENLKAPIDALRYQKALLDSLRDLEFVQRQLAVSKLELAALINLPPGTNYSVAVPKTLRIEGLKAPVRQMEELALIRNPDIREASYQVRISVEETHKMLARNLPGINFSYGPNYDSNSFLVNNTWTAGAVRLSGNLISIISIPEQLKRGHLAEDTAITRRQALSVATLARLHIAYQQYLAAVKEYRWADQLAGVDRRLYEQISNRTETDAQSELERVSARVSAVESDLRRYRSYAEAQAALGRLYDVVGIDPVPDALASLDIGTLSEAIRRCASDWDNNRLDHISEAPAATKDVATPADTTPAVAAADVAGSASTSSASTASAAMTTTAAASDPAPQRSALATENQPVTQ